MSSIDYNQDKTAYEKNDTLIKIVNIIIPILTQTPEHTSSPHQ